MINSYLNLYARVAGKKVQNKIPSELTFSGTTDFDAEIATIESLALAAFQSMEELDFVSALASIKQIILCGNNTILGNHQFWTLVNGDAA